MIDTAEKRRAAAGIAAHPLGPAVTPTVGKDQEWRQLVGWGYSGILAGEPVIIIEATYESGFALGLYQMIVTVTDSFARPGNTTQYAANELVANSATAGSVTPLTFTTSALGTGRGIIRRVRLFKDDETTTAASFNIHLFTQSPVVTNGDNGAFAVSTARYFIGTVAVDMSSGAFATTTDLIKSAAASPEINFDLVHVSPRERRLYGLIETLGAYTPSADEVFEVTLELAAVN